jgi:hypothetical protein
MAHCAIHMPHIDGTEVKETAPSAFVWGVSAVNKKPETPPNTPMVAPSLIVSLLVSSMSRRFYVR